MWGDSTDQALLMRAAHGLDLLLQVAQLLVGLGKGSPEVASAVRLVASCHTGSVLILLAILLLCIGIASLRAVILLSSVLVEVALTGRCSDVLLSVRVLRSSLTNHCVGRGWVVGLGGLRGRRGLIAVGPVLDEVLEGAGDTAGHVRHLVDDS